MKKYMDLIICTIIVIIFYITNYVTLNSTLIYLFILSLAFLFLLKIYGFRKNTLRYKKDVLLTVLISILMYFLVSYLSGLFFGFRETIYNMNFTVFITLIVVLLTNVVKELIRYILLLRYKDDKKMIVYITLFLILINILPQLQNNNFNSLENVIKFFGLILLPAVFENILFSYLSLKVGYESNIIYLTLMKGYIYIVPFIPNYNEYLTSIIYVSFPMLILYVIYIQFYRKNVINIRQNKILPVIRNVLFLILFAIILLVSGYFRYFAITIGSESMFPVIDKGDIVIIEKMDEIGKIKEGEILAFNYNGRIIVHRIEQRIVNQNNKISFQTKGDNNNSVDEHIVTSDEIVGVVRMKVKYIGLPTIWLNEVLN